VNLGERDEGSTSQGEDEYAYLNERSRDYNKVLNEIEFPANIEPIEAYVIIYNIYFQIYLAFEFWLL
jgi:hypothetical protein